MVDARIKNGDNSPSDCQSEMGVKVEPFCLRQLLKYSCKRNHINII